MVFSLEVKKLKFGVLFQSDINVFTLSKMFLFTVGMYGLWTLVLTYVSKIMNGGLIARSICLHILEDAFLIRSAS